MKDQAALDDFPCYSQANTGDGTVSKCMTCGASTQSPLRCLGGYLGEKLTQARQEISLSRKSQIFKPGEAPSGLFCIEKGVIKLTRRGPDGRQVILRLVEPGDILGLSQILMNEAHKESAEVIEDAKFCFIPREAFEDLMANSPELNRQLLQAVTEMSRATEENFVILASRSVRERMAETLLQLAKKHGRQDEQGLTIHLNLTREELASIAGTVLETAVRTLKEFKDDGLISIDGRKITLLNPEGLKRISS